MNEKFKTVLGVVFGTIGLCVVVGLLFASEKVEVERSLVDASTHCPKGKPKKVWGVREVYPPKIPKNTAILIDATDQIQESHKDRISTWFEENFTKSIIRFERVAIYEVRPQEDSANPVLSEPNFDQCVPPVEPNPWIENPGSVRKKFEKDFMQKKLKAIKSLASQNEALWSPILEVVENLFEDYDRIVLISDLMQHTPECSLYRRHNTVQNYSGCQLFFQNSLDKKNLDVIFLKRKEIVSLQGDALLDFWRRRIEEKNGTFMVQAKLPVIN